jgi:hypothetical protein
MRRRDTDFAAVFSSDRDVSEIVSGSVGATFGPANGLANG